MQTNVKAPKAPKATNTANTANTAIVVPAAPAAPAAPKAEKPLSLRAIALAAHNAAGFNGGTYAGPSRTRNTGIIKAPNLATSKAVARTYAQLTERMHSTLRDIATKHGAKAFPLCGIDRGQAAIFLASGFFAASGESNATLSADTLARYTTKA